jgi:hypothetical protein
MQTRSQPQAVREIHEIRERLYEERKTWTAAQRREYYERLAKEAARRGLGVLPHATRKSGRNHA